jgi:hypothetical protein
MLLRFGQQLGKNMAMPTSKERLAVLIEQD